MKKACIFISLNILFINLCLTQIKPIPSLPIGWERVYIKNVGSFDLPPTMEIQSGIYKKLMNDIYKIMEYDAPHLVGQPKGINSLEKEGLGKYSRVMIKTIIGSIGDYDKLHFNISNYSQSEIFDMNLIAKQETENGFKGTDIKLIEWFPLKLIDVNGMSCIHISGSMPLIVGY